MKNETYKLELSEESFNKLAQKISDIPAKLGKVKIKILKRLAQYATDRIIYYISTTTNEYTGDLVNSITTSEIFNDTIEIYTENAYAMYVEYGTGIVGSQNPHPLLDGWKYDVNEHGDKGWYYQDVNGEWHWTKGEKSHQFMYKAFQDLEANYIQIAEQIFYEEDLL